jgi:hypothetical protein
MTVSPIDVIARTDGFEHAAAQCQLRPWEWSFIHAVDGHMQLQEVAAKCGLDLDTATEIVFTQAQAGLLCVVTMTLDGYRQWSGLATGAVLEAPASAEPARAAVAEPLPQASSDLAEPVAAMPLPEPEHHEMVAEPLAVESAFAVDHAPVIQAEPEAEPEPAAEPLHAALPESAWDFEPDPEPAHEPASEPVDEPAYEPAYASAYQTAPEPVLEPAFDAAAAYAYAASAIESVSTAVEQPVAHAETAPEPSVPEPATHASFGYEPFAQESAAAPPPAIHESPAASVADDYFVPETFTSEPFAHEPFAHEGVTHEPVAHEAVAQEPKVVSFSLDSADDFAPATAAESTERHAPEPARDGISLSFEPGDHQTYESLPTFPSVRSGVSLSFDSLTPAPSVPEPAVESAFDFGSSAPISLSFSPDGFPILTPPEAAPAPPVEAVASATPVPVGAAEHAPAAEHVPVAEHTSAVEDSASAAEPSERSMPAAKTESADVVGSLIARVLSIRIR